MIKIRKINHIAIAVENIEQALTFWQDALGLQLQHVENVTSQNAKVAFLPVGEGELELVQPTEKGTSLIKFLSEKGPGLHHICIEVENIGLALEELKSKGVRLINETPQELPCRKMAFIHPKSSGGVLVELYEITN